jgi:hypothetical protein
MSYSTSNPPALLIQSIGGPRVWTYKSTDAMATVDGSGYITNGYDLGMRANDTVIVTDTTNQIVSTHIVITATAPNTVDLGNGTTIGTATNSD